MSTTRLAVLSMVLGWALAAHPATGAGPRFTDNGDGTVTDHERGLVWSRTDNRGDIGWKDAERWVRFTFPDTVPGGTQGWRLPTVDELRSLYGEGPGYETDCGQWVKIAPEIELTCGWVWSAETSAIQAYAFSFQRGYSYAARMAHRRGYRALAVRSLP